MKIRICKKKKAVPVHGASCKTSCGTQGLPQEYCVLCHEDTGYTADVPIEKRQYYYEGCGQLCLNCYRKIQEEQQLLWGGPKAEHCMLRK